MTQPRRNEWVGGWRNVEHKHCRGHYIIAMVACSKIMSSLPYLETLIMSSFPYLEVGGEGGGSEAPQTNKPRSYT
jgi:hypothetical protein